MATKKRARTTKDDEIRRLKTTLVEKERALALLRETTQTLTAFAAHSKDIIFRIRIPDGQYEYMSPAVTEITGYCPEDCYRQPFFVRSVMPPEWREFLDQGWQEAVKGNLEPFNEYPIVHRLGALRWCHQRNWLVWDDRHERPIALEGIVIDVTERRRVEEALRNSELEYRTMVDSLSDTLHVVDENLRIVLFNRAGRNWIKTLGIDAEPVGMPLWDLFPFLPRKVRDEYQSIFSTGCSLNTEDRTLVEGEEIVTETHKIPIVEGGKVVRVITTVRDVTKAMRAKEQLRQAEKMEALGQLAGGVAHDFNNQLTAVLGYAELLTERISDGELRGYAETITQTAARSAELTRQLLAFARKGKYRSELVDVHHLIREVIALLTRTIDKRIRIREALEAPRWETVGDPVQLSNALLNLGINARDAMPDGGELTFATELVTLDAQQSERTSPSLSPGRFVRIRVDDTGVGMTTQTRKRLFEPFFTTKGPGKGTGLGLAAVYGTVANHQGAIEVQSAPDHGSMIAVYLPLAATAGVTEALHPQADLVRGVAHILVTDDETPVRDMAAAALRHLGYRVTTFGDGAEASNWYESHVEDVDLVILDMVMPNLNGRDTLARMRAVNPSVKVLLTTGYSVEDQARSASEAGISGLIQKPFHLRDLATKVAQALGGDAAEAVEASP